MQLPTSKIPALTASPKKLILYGPPKIGKTTILSTLENCLIVDLEDGSDFVEAMKIKIKDFKEFNELGMAIHKAGYPYQYIAWDTITKLEEWCEKDATDMYKKTPMGVNFKGETVLSLGNGGGYLYLRESYKKWIERAYSLSPRSILIGHIKDKMIEKKTTGEEVSSKDLDLTGKIKSITAANADAIGYLFRKDGVLWVTFESKEDIVCGSRCQHLKGQSFPFDWKKIYID